MSKHSQVITWKGFPPRGLDNMIPKTPSISDCLSRREPESPSTECKVPELTSHVPFYHLHTENAQSIPIIGVNKRS